MLYMMQFTLGTPLKSRSTRHDRLDGLRRKYRGIFWDTAADECTDAQFDMIVETLRIVVLDVLPLRGSHNDRSESSAFNRFFIRPSERGIANGWQNSVTTVEEYRLILEAMDLSSKFLVYGKEKNLMYTRARQIKFKCQPFPFIPCTGQAARTSGVQADEDQGWSTVFCPPFFEEVKFIQEIGNGPQKRLTDLAILASREHVMVHELMHADVATGRWGTNHIIDVISSIPGTDGMVKMYGAQRCHEFAWKYADQKQGNGVNPEVSWNADNYAWYYSNEFFAKRWGWVDDGRTLNMKTLGEEMDVPPLEFDDPSNPEGLLPADLTPAPQPNCIFLSDVEPWNNWYCAYMGTDLQTWIAERNDPFMSEGGCILS